MDSNNNRNNKNNKNNRNLRGVLVLLAASLFSVGVWIFRKVKGAAK